MLSALPETPAKRACPACARTSRAVLLPPSGWWRSAARTTAHLETPKNIRRSRATADGCRHQPVDGQFGPVRRAATAAVFLLPDDHPGPQAGRRRPAGGRRCRPGDRSAGDFLESSAAASFTRKPPPIRLGGSGESWKTIVESVENGGSGRTRNRGEVPGSNWRQPRGPGGRVQATSYLELVARVLQKPGTASG